MTPAASDRSKAARLRKRIKSGAKLKPPELAWLRSYERSTKPKQVRLTDEPAKESPPVTVHTTEPPPSEAVDPQQHTWSPRVPVDGATEPQPGEPQPPPAGTPLVTEQPQPPSEAAAQQLAVFVGFIVSVGVASVHELMSDVALPDALRAIVYSPKLAAGAVEVTSGAAKRLAMKYGMREIPYADECIVLGASALSIVCTVMAAKRRLAAPTPKTEAQPPSREPDASQQWPTTVVTTEPDAKAPSVIAPLFDVSGRPVDGLRDVNALWNMPRQAEV